MMPYRMHLERQLRLVLRVAGLAIVLGSCHRADAPLAPPPAPPTFTGIVPSIGLLGTSLTVTLSGSNFIDGATTVTAHGSGLTVSGVTVITSSTLTATLVVDGKAVLGEDTLWVATAGGSSGAQVFTVRPHTAALVSITPSTAVDSTTVAVTMVGKNFVSGATTITTGNAGITVNSIVVSNDTTLTANFVVATKPTALTTSVSVQTAGGTSDSVAFMVTTPPPGFTGMTPTSALQGSTGSVHITGDNFIVNGTSLPASGTGLSFTGVVATSDTTIGATYVIGQSAPLGDRTVTVRTASGVSQSRTFTIMAPVPLLNSLSPVSGVAGTTVAVTLKGVWFEPGATTVTVSDPAVTVNSVSEANGVSLTANFVIAANATPGNDTVVVTTPGGTSASQTFSVAAHGSQLFAYTGGIQSFTVPAGYTAVTITAAGAGGGSPGGGVPGGNGASVTGTFSVASGATLSVIVGGGGGPGYSGNLTPGAGGGGSFVFDASSSLMIAGGGGGGGCTVCDVNTPDAVFTTAGAAGTGAGGAGGVAGSGGAADTVFGGGGGGGGTTGGGGGIQAQYNGSGGGATSASSGGAGGAPFLGGPAVGGYGGGGGGGNRGGGGGGGFSGGGGGGTNATPGSGGGGGSFNSGTAQSTARGALGGGVFTTPSFGVAGGNGWVLIVW